MTLIAIIKNRVAALMVGVCVAGGMVAGCAPSGKHLSPDFGEAYSEAFAAQVANPGAPDNPGAADALPGEVSNQIYQKRYLKAMTEEKEEDDSGRMQNISSFR
jgi:hypothetical protein